MWQNVNNISHLLNISIHSYLFVFSAVDLTFYLFTIHLDENEAMRVIRLILLLVHAKTSPNPTDTDHDVLFFAA